MKLIKIKLTKRIDFCHKLDFQMLYRNTVRPEDIANKTVNLYDKLCFR